MIVCSFQVILGVCKFIIQLDMSYVCMSMSYEQQRIKMCSNLLVIGKCGRKLKMWLILVALEPPNFSLKAGISHTSTAFL